MLAFIQKYKRTFLIILAVLAVLFAGFVYISFRAVNDLFETDKVTPTAAQYAEWVGVWLPETPEDFQAYGEGWQDWLVEAKFEMPSSELSEFLERNRLQPVDLKILPESSYQLEWFSSSAKLEVYEIVPLPEQAAATSTGFYATFWLDKTKPDKVTVYIKANDT
jgi:hypothetical protein